MQQLDVDEIRQITTAISTMGEVDAGIVEEIIAEFDEKVNPKMSKVNPKNIFTAFQRITS